MAAEAKTVTLFPAHLERREASIISLVTGMYLIFKLALIQLSNLFRLPIPIDKLSCRNRKTCLKLWQPVLRDVEEIKSLQLLWCYMCVVDIPSFIVG